MKGYLSHVSEEPCNIRIWSSRQSQDDMPKVKVALACCKYMGNEYALIRLL